MARNPRASDEAPGASGRAAHRAPIIRARSGGLSPLDLDRSDHARSLHQEPVRL